jgi:tetratricopeptide (TPR) repeat protein
MFTLDSDIIGLQKGIESDFLDPFRHAYVDYISGQWEEALQYLKKALDRKPEDGPSLTIKAFIESHKGKPPEEWEKEKARKLLDNYF